MNKNKRGQVSFGFLTFLVFAIASFVIGLIICFVVIDTFTGANLLANGRPTITVTNESQVVGTGDIVFINQTSYTFQRTNSSNSAYTVSAVVGSGNQSNGSAQGITNVSAYGYNVTITSGNYTVNQNGTIINATNNVFPNVSISYSFATLGVDELATNQITGNFSTGIQNDVAPKVRTAVIIGGIVFLVGLLAILLAVWRKMNGGGTTSII